MSGGGCQVRVVIYFLTHGLAFQNKQTRHPLFWIFAWSCRVLSATQYSTWHRSCRTVQNIIHTQPYSGISFDILFDILSDTLSDRSSAFCLPFFLTKLLTFRTSYWHEPQILSDISFDILSDISFDILSDISSDMLSSDTRLRSGAEHWPHRIAAEVRRGTLNTQDRGWGPARNTEHTGSQLRSGAEHWTHRIAVEVRRGTLASPDRCWGPTRNTDHTSSQEATEDETKEEAEERRRRRRRRRRSRLT